MYCGPFLQSCTPPVRSSTALRSLTVCAPPDCSSSSRACTPPVCSSAALRSPTVCAPPDFSRSSRVCTPPVCSSATLRSYTVCAPPGCPRFSRVCTPPVCSSAALRSPTVCAPLGCPRHNVLRSRLPVCVPFRAPDPIFPYSPPSMCKLVSLLYHYLGSEINPKKRRRPLPDGKGSRNRVEVGGKISR